MGFCCLLNIVVVIVAIGFIVAIGVIVGSNFIVGIGGTCIPCVYRRRGDCVTVIKQARTPAHPDISQAIRLRTPDRHC